MSFLSSSIGGALQGLGAGLGGSYANISTQPIEIPSEMDDWDCEFERLTGSLPSFSRLFEKRQTEKRWMELQAQLQNDWRARAWG